MKKKFAYFRKKNSPVEPNKTFSFSQEKENLSRKNMNKSKLIFDLWSSPHEKIVPGLNIPYLDVLRTTLFLSLREGEISLNDIDEAVQILKEKDPSAQPKFLYSLLYRSGRRNTLPENISLSLIELDSPRAQIETDDDLATALRFHSQNVLKGYNFSAKDLNSLQIAIHNAEIESVQKLLPFSSSPISLPPENCSFRLISDELRKISGLVHLHNEKIRRKKIHFERVNSLYRSK